MIRKGLIALLLLAAGCLPAAAWAPETRVQMADKAIQMMPRSLRMALESHRRDLLRGMLEPLTREVGMEGRPPWDGGSLDATIENRARALVRSVERSADFDEIAERFGILAHYVLDAGFPPSSSDEGAVRYPHFAGFCRQKQEKFPLVFYGHDAPALARNDFKAYALEMLERARDEDRQLARAYAAAGDPPDPGHFDDRSVPFAVGSLSYSRAVTDLTRVWIAAWRLSNGDTGRTPYLDD